MKLTVIIPVFNEENSVAGVVDQVLQAPVTPHQVLIVDDGSTDRTPQILKHLDRPSITIYRHHRNLGKGAAIRTALEAVRGDVILIQDADLEYDPADYSRLLEPIQKNQSGIVYGSRILGLSARGSLLFYLGGRFLSFLTNLLYGTHLTDVTTGYKVFRTEILRQISWQSNRFGFCVEVTARLAHRGEKIIEVPISYHPRSFAQGKKISVSAGVAAACQLILLKARLRRGRDSKHRGHPGG